MMDYCINPVKMSGRITAISDGCVTTNLRGRLGVITVSDRYVTSRKPLCPGDELEFYFSYIQVVERPLDYDLSDMNISSNTNATSNAKAAPNTNAASNAKAAPNTNAISDTNADKELFPSLLGGTIIEINDTAVRVGIMNNIGTIYVPRRWVFTPFVLQQNQQVEFYLSCMRVIDKHTVFNVEEEHYATHN